MKENPYDHLDNRAYRVAFLIAGYLRNTLTEKEHDELNDWVNASDHNMQLFEELTDETNLETNLAWMDKVQTEHSFKDLQAAGAFEKPAKKFEFSRIWIAAASVILVIGVFLAYRYSTRADNGSSTIAGNDTVQLKPGGNRATLTLEDGTIIDLASAKIGSIRSVVGSRISKPVDGELVYARNGETSGLSAIHTLSTPVGGQYYVVLPDGTRAWLNAATTIKYPASFDVGDRWVEVTGEVYFEVAKSENQAFHVILNNIYDITVLGTHFNTMAYADEEAKEVTLLEGRLKVSSAEKTELLSPGMQAIITADNIKTRSGVDTKEVVGWKNGLFVFHDASIESIMRQVERWYGAKVVYEGENKQSFNATILRSEPVSKLLHLLELNGYAHFKIENGTIHVLP